MLRATTYALDWRMSFSDITVIIRSCGRPLLLRRAMQSVMDQMLQPEEIVLVALGECGLSAAEEFRSCARVSIVEVSENRIRGGALNDGINACTSPLLAFLDDDDTWDPRFLSEMAKVAAMQCSPTFGAVVCHSEVIYEKLVEGKVEELRREPFNSKVRAIDSDSLFYGNQFTINAALWRRDVFRTTFGFSEELSVMEDWEFNRRASLGYGILVLPQILARYHRRPATDILPNSLLREHGKIAWLLQKYWLSEAEFFGSVWHRRNVGRWWARLKRLRARIKAV